MTNADLRKHLERFPDDAKVLFSSPNGTTYLLDRVYPPTEADNTILLDTHDSENVP